MLKRHDDEEAGIRAKAAASAPVARASTDSFEERVNLTRGWTCLCIVSLCLYVTFSEPRCLAFWMADGYTYYADEATGLAGAAAGYLFLAYISIDTLVCVVWRHRFKRSMASLLVHHLAAIIALALILIPYPRRGYFVWGVSEVLTVVRLLPAPSPRFQARSHAFAFRRVLFVYLLSRGGFVYTESLDLWGAVVAATPIVGVMRAIGAEPALLLLPYTRTRSSLPPKSHTHRTLLSTLIPFVLPSSSSSLASSSPSPHALLLLPRFRGSFVPLPLLPIATGAVPARSRHSVVERARATRRPTHAPSLASHLTSSAGRRLQRYRHTVLQGAK